MDKKINFGQRNEILDKKIKFWAQILKIKFYHGYIGWHMRNYFKLSVKDCTVNRTDPYFIRQCDEIFKISFHQNYDEILQSLPDDVLTFALKVHELGFIDKVFHELYQMVRAELRGFKKSRQDAKGFKRIEAIFLVMTLLLKGTQFLDKKIKPILDMIFRK